jgi:integrase/recombinase XerD
MLLLALQTGLRISELTALTIADFTSAPVRTSAATARAARNRITPLTNDTVNALRGWLAERGSTPTAPLFPTRRGTALSRDAIERRIALHAANAASQCPTLRDKKITAHMLRHTTAMRLLHAGVDTSVIALWLGHEQVDTTQIYLHADLAL